MHDYDVSVSDWFDKEQKDRLIEALKKSNDVCHFAFVRNSKEKYEAYYIDGREVFRREIIIVRR